MKQSEWKWKHHAARSWMRDALNAKDFWTSWRASREDSRTSVSVWERTMSHSYIDTFFLALIVAKEQGIPRLLRVPAALFVTLVH